MATGAGAGSTGDGAGGASAAPEAPRGVTTARDAGEEEAVAVA